LGSQKIKEKKQLSYRNLWLQHELRIQNGPPAFNPIPPLWRLTEVGKGSRSQPRLQTSAISRSKFSQSALNGALAQSQGQLIKFRLANFNARCWQLHMNFFSGDRLPPGRCPTAWLEKKTCAADFTCPPFH